MTLSSKISLIIQNEGLMNFIFKQNWVLFTLLTILLISLCYKKTRELIQNNKLIFWSLTIGLIIFLFPINEYFFGNIINWVAPIELYFDIIYLKLIWGGYIIFLSFFFLISKYFKALENILKEQKIKMIISFVILILASITIAHIIITERTDEFIFLFFLPLAFSISGILSQIPAIQNWIQEFKNKSQGKKILLFMIWTGLIVMISPLDFIKLNFSRVFGGLIVLALILIWVILKNKEEKEEKLKTLNWVWIIGFLITFLITFYLSGILFFKLPPLLILILFFSSMLISVICAWILFDKKSLLLKTMFMIIFGFIGLKLIEPLTKDIINNIVSFDIKFWVFIGLFLIFIFISVTFFLFFKSLFQLVLFFLLKLMEYPKVSKFKQSFKKGVIYFKKIDNFYFILSMVLIIFILLFGFCGTKYVYKENFGNPLNNTNITSNSLNIQEVNLINQHNLNYELGEVLKEKIGIIIAIITFALFSVFPAVDSLKNIVNK